MQRPTRGLLAAVSLALLSPALLVAPAQAEPAKTVATTVTYTNFTLAEGTQVTFHGLVKSKKPFCRSNRKVTLRQTTQGIVAGTGTSAPKGKWRVSFDGDNVDPGKFKVSVARKVVRHQGRKYVCLPASRTFTVEG